MPSTIKIRVYGARDLPVMDQSTGLADPFVTIKFGDTKKQETFIAKKTLNPVWQQTFRIDVADDNVLQDEPVVFRVFDKDLVTSDDSIGVVIVDLNSLLMNPNPNLPTINTNTAALAKPPSSAAAAPGTGASTTTTSLIPAFGTGTIPLTGHPQSNTDTTKISGWFPIYDTLHGIRGQLRLSIRLQFFGDVNPFKDSAAGMYRERCFCPHFISSHHFVVRVWCGVKGIPCYQVSSLEGYQIVDILGFVDELVLEFDPEYSYLDSFRSSRTSNETRQKLFYNLTSRVRRAVARKAIELGGNAVLGYRQLFDLEGESGITARAYGTAVRIVPLHDSAHSPSAGAGGGADTPTTRHTGGHAGSTNYYRHHPLEFLGGVNLSADGTATGSGGASGGAAQAQSTPTRGGNELVDEKGVPIASAGAAPQPIAGPTATAWNKRDVHLLTLTEFPVTVQLTCGGLVSTSAIKLLEGSYDKGAAEVRDTWWREIRQEIKNHARALRCNLVIGYSEVTTIYEGM